MSKRRSLTRLSGFRDASIIGIACEGDVTERRYFEEFITRYTKYPSRIHIEIIERQNVGDSAPEYVVESIDAFRKNIGAHPDDEYWAVIDYDQWRDEKLSLIAQQVSQKEYRLAVSRPCFEAWLLLHLIPETDLDAAVLAKLEAGGCGSVTDEIRRIRGHYRKSLADTSDYIDQAESAIHNAKALDSAQSDRWPQSFGSRVYQICEKIKEQ